MRVSQSGIVNFSEKQKRERQRQRQRETERELKRNNIYIKVIR